MIKTEEFRAKYPDHVTGKSQDISKANLLHLSRLMELMPENAVALEIGCFNGGTTVWLLENGISRIDVIDPFTGSPEHEGIVDRSSIMADFERNTEKHVERISALVGKSCDELPRLCVLGAIYDFIYVDGSHDSQDVALDALLGFQLLKPGGVMCFDDAEWNYHDSPYRNPKSAIDFFIAAYAEKLRVLEKGYQVSVQKL